MTRRGMRTNAPGPSDWRPAPDLCAAVRSLARRWSRDRPDVREDLEQEALVAIWTKGETDAPLSHQLRTAQNRMLSVRKLGKSVDGKLNGSYQRRRQYTIVSVEQRAVAAEGGVLPLQDVLPSAFLVEPYVVSKLRLLELLSVLAADERACVGLLCAGFTTREVAAWTRSESATVMRNLHSARRKLRPLLDATRDEVGGDPVRHEQRSIGADHRLPRPPVTADGIAA